MSCSEEKETARALNELARHQMILRLLRDIRIDLEICKLEGYEYREYLTALSAIINGFIKTAEVNAHD